MKIPIIKFRGLQVSMCDDDSHYLHLCSQIACVQRQTEVIDGWGLCADHAAMVHAHPIESGYADLLLRSASFTTNVDPGDENISLAELHDTTPPPCSRRGGSCGDS